MVLAREIFIFFTTFLTFPPISGAAFRRPPLSIVFYASNFFTVNVALTPVPKVTPTARSAESAISITSPAARVIIILPLSYEPTPTDKTLLIVASGILLPFRRTAKVTVVPIATDSVFV